MPSIAEGPMGYLQHIGSHELLTEVQEQELATIIKNHKTGKERDKAISTLAEHNLKLVVKAAYKLAADTGAEFEELVGAGNLGLMRAATRFLPKQKTRFSTYASYWIYEAMQDFVYVNLSPVKIPVHISNGVARVKKLMEANNGKTLSTKEIMKQLKLSESTVKHILGANIQTIPLDKPINDSDGERADSVGDIIEDESAASPMSSSVAEDEHEKLRAALKQLEPLEREIIMARYMGEDKAQLRKLGKQFKITGERVRQIQENALKSLRKKLKHAKR